MAVAKYELTPNVNGGQDTEWPDGDKPDHALPPNKPTGFGTTVITSNSIGLTWQHDQQNVTRIEIEQWIFGSSTTWEVVQTFNPDVTDWNALGLPPKTHIGHRIQAFNGSEPSGYASEVWVDTLDEATQPPPSAGEWGGMIPSHYISASAMNGAGDGSYGNPWSWEDGCANAQPGNTLGWFAGFYTGKDPKPSLNTSNADDYRFRPAFCPLQSGSEGNPITMVAQWPAAHHTTHKLYTELVNGSDGRNPDTGEFDFLYPGVHDLGKTYYGWPVFGIDYEKGRHHIHWVGMYTDTGHPNNKIIQDCGAATVRSGHAPHVRECRIIADPNQMVKANNWSGIRPEDAPNSVFSDNYISGFGWDPVNGESNCAGILLYYCIDYVAEHNTIRDCNHGIFQKIGKYHGTHLYGDIRFNDIADCMHGFRIGSAGDKDDNTTRTRIYQNKIFNCTNILQQVDPNLAVTVRDTVKWVDFYNNTFYSTKNNAAYTACWELGWIQYRNEDVNVFNNIISAPGTSCGSYNRNSTYFDTSSGKWNNNCWHGQSNHALTNESSNSRKFWSLPDWRAQTGQEVASITDDPKFVDQANGDLRLQSGSPCLTAGERNSPQGCYITGTEQMGIRTQKTATLEWAGLTPTKFASDVNEFYNHLENAVAGDIVGLYPGVFTGSKPNVSDALLYHNPAFRPHHSGTADNPIIFVAQYPAAHHDNPNQYTELRNGHGPQSSATYDRTGWPTIGCPYTHPRHYVQYIGFLIDEKVSHVNENCGVINIWGSSFNKVLHCKVYGDPAATTGEYGGRVGGGNNYNAIRIEYANDFEAADNWFEDWYPAGYSVNNTPMISYSCLRTHWHHNYAKNVGYGWYQKGVNTGRPEGPSQGGDFHNNLVDGGWCGFRLMAPAIPKYNSSEVDATLMTYSHHNLCLGVKHAIEYAQTSAGGVCTLNAVYNNTFVAHKTGEYDAFWAEGNTATGDGIQGNDWYNNIMHDFRSTALSWSLSPARLIKYMPRDFNLWNYDQRLLNGGSQLNSIGISEWQNTYGQDVNSKFNEDPKFVDAANGDYRLQYGSPAEKSGRGGVNMGCYETGNEVIGIRRLS